MTSLPVGDRTVEYAAALLAIEDARARAMTGPAVRVAAYLHQALPRMHYGQVFTVATAAAELHAGSADGGSVLRWLRRCGVPAGQAMDVVDILRRPPKPRTLRELFPWWEAMSVAQRREAWAKWHMDRRG
jgi:hypothetical protein